MNYVTQSQYAKLSGVTRQSISHRVRTGLIETVGIADPTGKIIQYIDLDYTAPERLRRKSVHQSH